MSRASDRVPPTVAIKGRGIAASCCAHLLGREGFATSLQATERPPVPAILLSDPALALLRDVFAQPALFADKPRITRRIVAWGQSEPVVLPHGAIALSERDLDAALSPGAWTVSETSCDMTIHTAPPFPDSAMRHFGSRRASAAQAQLRHGEDQSACWIEAIEAGWLFLIPSPPAGSAWLLAVGAPIDNLLEQSRHIAPRVDLTGATSATFETSPRMLSVLQGPDWLACGTAAIAFDPICGDGTAQAIREAIMAAAVLAAIRDGEDPQALRTHYQSMLIAAMRRHLRLCAQFYQTGSHGAWWRRQYADLAEGFDWCTAQLASLPEPRYELRDFRLVAREVAA